MAADPDIQGAVAEAESRLTVLIRQLQGMIRTGSGAPTGTPASPTLYLRADGAAGTTLYLFRAGAWVAIA